MKKIIFLLACMTALLASCSNDNDEGYKTYVVEVQLTYPSESHSTPTEGVAVKLIRTSDAGAFEAKTDDNGKAVFSVPAGIYDISASERRIDRR